MPMDPYNKEVIDTLIRNMATLIFFDMDENAVLRTATSKGYDMKEAKRYYQKAKELTEAFANEKAWLTQERTDW